MNKDPVEANEGNMVLSSSSMRGETWEDGNRSHSWACKRLGFVPTRPLESSGTYLVDGYL